VADLTGRGLYLCTGDRPDLADFLASCIRGGVDVVQLREKLLTDRELLSRASQAREVCGAAGVPFIVNDRPDLALACGADGVHVGQDDVPVDVARRILGPTAIIGLSTHAPAEWDDAVSQGADYLSAGPVEATPTKPGRPGTGLGYLQYVSATGAAPRLPWFVTGGVTPATVSEMVRSGATRFVVVRYLTGSPDPETAARTLRSSIDKAMAEAGRD
jgi:thiamine-phosphate pyrophosphorylase